MSDRIAVFNAGRIEQVDAPTERLSKAADAASSLASSATTMCSVGRLSLLRAANMPLMDLAR